MLQEVTTGAYYPPVDTTWKILTTRSSYVVDSGSIVQWCRSGSFLNVGGHSSPLISLLSRLFCWQTGFPSDQSCHLLAILNEIAPNLLAPWTHCSKKTSDFGSQDLLDPQTGLDAKLNMSTWLNLTSTSLLARALITDAGCMTERPKLSHNRESRRGSPTMPMIQLPLLTIDLTADRGS